MSEKAECVLCDVIENMINKQIRPKKVKVINKHSDILPSEVCEHIKQCQNTDLVQLLAELLCKNVLNELAYCEDYLDDDTKILEFILNTVSINKTKLIIIKNTFISEYKKQRDDNYNDIKNLFQIQINKFINLKNGYIAKPTYDSNDSMAQAWMTCFDGWIGVRQEKMDSYYQQLTSDPFTAHFNKLNL